MASITFFGLFNHLLSISSGLSFGQTLKVGLVISSSTETVMVLQTKTPPW